MKKTVYAYLHTHWDREWYRDKEDFNIRLQKVFDTILDELTSNRAPFFYFDGQVCALLDYLKFNPDKKNVIKNLIRNKKLAIGPYYVSADSFLISYIMMLKNIDLGIKYSNEFSKQEFIGYMCDIFGISKSAFEALKHKNINKAIIWRGINPKDINYNCNFNINNINTTWLSMGYFNDFLHNNNISGLNDYISKIFKYSHNNCLLPIGADHLGILKNANKIIDNINLKLSDCEIKLTNPFEYFKKNKFNNIAKSEEFLDNSKTYILQGVYSTRINQKIKNVKIQNKLSKIVEPLNFYLKGKYSNQIEYVYETLLKNHAHDGIYGCSTDSVAKAVDSRFNKCNQMLDSILMHIKYDFKAKNRLEGKSKQNIGLFNLTNQDNIKIIKIKSPYIMKNAQILEKERGFFDEIYYDCYKIPVTEEICDIYTQLVEIDSNKKFSYKNVKIKKPKTKFLIDNNYIENQNIGLYIENNEIKIKNKKNDKIFKIKLTDIKDSGDSYNFAPTGLREEIPLIKSEILYKGPIESSLRLYFKNITLDAYINSYCKFIKFNATIHNNKKNHKLQLCIVANKDINSTIAQDAFGIIKRIHNPNYNIQNEMPAKRPYELKTNEYPMQNFVVFQNLIALTKGLHEYEIYKNELRICLLRCIGTISNPKNPARAIPAGPDLKIPNAQMQGIQNAEFALMFGGVDKAFCNLDIFMENYVTITNISDNNYELKLNDIADNNYFYGINQGNNIIYNYKDFK